MADDQQQQPAIPATPPTPAAATPATIPANAINLDEERVTKTFVLGGRVYIGREATLGDDELIDRAVAKLGEEPPEPKIIGTRDDGSVIRAAASPERIRWDLAAMKERLKVLLRDEQGQPPPPEAFAGLSGSAISKLFKSLRAEDDEDPT